MSIIEHFIKNVLSEVIDTSNRDLSMNDDGFIDVEINNLYKCFFQSLKTIRLYDNVISIDFDQLTKSELEIDGLRLYANIIMDNDISEESSEIRYIADVESVNFTFINELHTKRKNWKYNFNKNDDIITYRELKRYIDINDVLKTKIGKQLTKEDVIGSWNKIKIENRQLLNREVYEFFKDSDCKLV